MCSALVLLSCELRVIQFGVRAASAQQFGVRAAFYDLTLIHNENDVRALDSGKSVRNNERRFLLAVFGTQQLVERRLHALFGARVDIARRLVEYHHRRIGEHYSRYIYELLLSLRNTVAVVYYSVVAVRQTLDEPVYIGGVRRGFYLVVGSVGLAVRNVVAHGAFEYPAILQYHAETLANAAAAQSVGIVAVEQNPARIGVVEPHQ